MRMDPIRFTVAVPFVGSIPSAFEALGRLTRVVILLFKKAIYQMTKDANANRIKHLQNDHQVQELTSKRKPKDIEARDDIEAMLLKSSDDETSLSRHERDTARFTNAVDIDKANLEYQATSVSADINRLTDDNTRLDTKISKTQDQIQYQLKAVARALKSTVPGWGLHVYLEEQKLAEPAHTFNRSRFNNRKDAIGS